MSFQCFNRGCNQRYDEDKNHDEACTHHPGLPYFHDAYKIWSCCKKKSIDFTQFLDIKGCTKSKHSNIKPEVPAKKEKDVNVENINNVPFEKAVSFERPSELTPMGKLNFTIASSLKSQLEKINNTNNLVNEEKGKFLSIIY